MIGTDTDLSALAGEGLAVALVGQPAMRFGRGGETINAWLHVAPDGTVTAYSGKVEIGQGIRTSFAQLVAEELRAPLSAVRMVMGDTDLVPWDMGTFGSMSTPMVGPSLRKVAAAARERLLELAAEAWDVDRAGLQARGGSVHEGAGGKGRSAGYGELVSGLEIIERVGDDGVELTPADAWTVAGHDATKVDARDVVTGNKRYTSDVKRPGMMFGKVVRPPTTGATLEAVDTTGAGAVPGAIAVDAIDDGFAGVAAPSLGQATAAVAAMRPEWTPAEDAGVDTRSVYEYLKATRPSSKGPREGEWMMPGPFVEGDAAAALANAEVRLERSYRVAYIAHVPLEPRAAVAEWSTDGAGTDDDGPRLTVWTGTQRPFGVREALAEAFDLPEDRVRVVMPDTGAGYGGKHTPEAAIEAARLARAAGRPVRVAWTREEEMRHAYFRPAGVIDVAAGLDEGGRITAWTFDNYNSGAAAIRAPYPIANQRIEFHPSEHVLRQGSYRGLAGAANFFARETHVSELAEKAGLDPVAFRLKNLEDARLRAVLEAAAERFGWGAKLPAGHGAGIACGIEKGGHVATCAEVVADRATGSVRVVRGVTAFDCGAVVNPDGLKNQITGAFIQGLGGALFEEIEFDHGVVRSSLLSRYRVPRFSDVPEIDVVLVDRKDAPSLGAGETPLMAVAPAIGAAIYDATGIRPRSLPMARDGIEGA